jgi:hypothetical protein
MRRKSQVGFSQRIQLEWLEQTATLLLAGNSKEEIQTTLQDILKDELSVGSDARWGNRGKSITLLLNIWVSVSSDIQDLRNDGLELLKQTSVADHLPIHWGMSMAAYPFFGSVAETAGRLLQLQGNVVAAHVQRRLQEQFGERETVSRAARRVLRCFIDWGVLQDTDNRGVYKPMSLKAIENSAIAAWLIEATLLASDANSKPLQAIIQSPALFPFSINLPITSQLGENNRLELFRQGLDIDMVSLRAG